jgi:type VI secretion system protein
MFRERTLLERLTVADGGGGSRTMTEDINALMKSVLRNLQRVLNARVGNAAAQMDLGTMSPIEVALAYPDSVVDAQRKIRECIETYEPRLKDINVTWIESDEERLSLRFQISGRLATTTRHGIMSFDTVFDPSGEIQLHS